MIITLGYVYASHQNGGVFSIHGISPCIAAGCHSDVQPRILVIHERDDSPRVAQALW